MKINYMLAKLCNNITQWIGINGMTMKCCSMVYIFCLFIIAYYFWIMLNRLQSFHQKIGSSEASIGIISSIAKNSGSGKLDERKYCVIAMRAGFSR